jgi:hypothetical protein
MLPGAGFEFVIHYNYHFDFGRERFQNKSYKTSLPIWQSPGPESCQPSRERGLKTYITRVLTLVSQIYLKKRLNISI